MAATIKKGAKVSLEMPASHILNGETIPKAIKVTWEPRRRFIDRDTRVLESLRRSLIMEHAMLDAVPGGTPRHVETRPDVISWLLQEYAKKIGLAPMEPQTKKPG